MWSNGRSETAALEAALPVPIEIRPLRSAKRLRLRFDDRAGILKLTCPARTSRRAALAWALDQSDWIATQLRRSPAKIPLADGAVIPVEGRDTRLEWVEGASRHPELSSEALRCGGPLTSFPRRIQAFLKQLALETMSRDVEHYAAIAGVTVASVTVGDAASRWGSCSSAGRIRLSWRLIMAPAEVRRFVVAHEVAHRVHLNHGPGFKALEARLVGPGLAAAKAELRRSGPLLRRIGGLV